MRSASVSCKAGTYYITLHTVVHVTSWSRRRAGETPELADELLTSSTSVFVVVLLRNKRRQLTTPLPRNVAIADTPVPQRITAKNWFDEIAKIKRCIFCITVYIVGIINR